MINSLELSFDDLPLWMQQAQQKFDWGSVFIILFGFLLAWNLTQQANILPNASQNYAFQTANIVEAFEEGYFYPRWTPNALRGLGAPIPHFYPQGAAYSAALLEVFFINDATIAVRYISILMLSFAGLGLYKFLSIWFNVRKAWISAMLYMFNPYIGLINPYVTGDLAWIFSVTLIPILLWIVSRLLLQGGNFNLFATAIIFVVLLLTDLHGAILGFIALSILIIGIYWQSKKHPNENRLFRYIDFKKNIILILDGLVAGTMMSAFFWLPAFVERNMVKWQTLSSTVVIETINWKHLFSPIWSSQSLDKIPLTIGYVLPLFTFIALIVLIYHKHVTIQTIFLVSGIVSLFIMLLFPTVTWLLLFTILSFAIGGSLLTDIVEKYSVRQQRTFFWGIATLILLSYIPQTRISLPPDTPFTANIDAQIDYEIREQTVVTLPIGNKLPSVVPYEFLPPFIFIRNVRQGNANHIATNRFPTQAQVEQLSNNNFQYKFRVRTEEATSFALYLAYFEGWNASLNEQQLRVQPNESGLIEIFVPENTNGIIQLELGTTPTRMLSWIISGITLCVLIIFMIWRQTHQQQNQSFILHTQTTSDLNDLLGLGVLLAIIMIGIIYG